MGWGGGSLRLIVVGVGSDMHWFLKTKKKNNGQNVDGKRGERVVKRLFGHARVRTHTWTRHAHVLFWRERMRVFQICLFLFVSASELTYMSIFVMNRGKHGKAIKMSH